MPRTTISLTTDTRDRLKAIGRKGESYDDLVNRLIDRHLGVEANTSAGRARADARRTPAPDELDFERIR